MPFLSPHHQEQAGLAVVIVTLDVKDFLLENLRALMKSDCSSAVEVIVIDNASKDETVEAIRKEFPFVRVIANASNHGFALANIQGLLVRHSRHVLLLNPDMHVEPDTLQKTIEYLETHENVAVVGGKLVNEKGGIIPHVRRFPDVWSQLAILLKLPHVFSRVLDHYLMKDFDYEKEQAVDSIRGSYFAIHERALQAIGGLDTRYFVWFEEVDYCRRAKEHGMRVMYVPWIHATDFVGRFFIQRHIYWKQKRFTRSMVQYFEKWHPWWQVWILRAVRVPALFVAWIADFMKR